MEDFKKVYRIGTAKTYRGRAYSVFVEAEYKDGRLSLHGVEGPTVGGNCIGGCGQIDMHLKPEHLTPGPGWTRAKIARLLAIWGEWHLNDMKAGCEHQRANWDTETKVTVTDYSWTTKYHELTKKAAAGELTAEEYEEFQAISAKVTVVTVAPNRPKYETDDIRALIAEGWIKAGRTEEKAVNWVHPYEHPAGILAKPCEVCGYKYGTSWLKVEVPEEVLQELKDFPDTDRQPAWV